MFCRLVVAWAAFSCDCKVAFSFSSLRMSISRKLTSRRASAAHEFAEAGETPRVPHGLFHGIQQGGVSMVVRYTVGRLPLAHGELVTLMVI